MTFMATNLRNPIILAKIEEEIEMKTGRRDGASPPGHQGVIADGEDTLTLHGYKRTTPRMALYYLCVVCTLGLYRVVLHWRQQWRAKALGISCCLDEADMVLIKNDDQEIHFRVVTTERSDGDSKLPDGHGGLKTVSGIRWFSYRKMRYYWIETQKKFMAPSQIDQSVAFCEYQAISDRQGLDEEVVVNKRKIYGSNEIVIPKKSAFEIILREAISPFCLFQAFSVTVWMNDDYHLFACVIVFLTLLGIFTTYREVRKCENRLREMAAQHGGGEVEVMRGGVIKMIKNAEVVPGDLVLVPQHGCTLSCDLVLLTGQVICNESMLTGESVPVTKAALPSHEENGELVTDVLIAGKHDKHILYGGTEVLQTRYYAGKRVKAIVLRTGFATSKGQLVRSIMYPKAPDFEFTKDLLKFVGFLFGVACCGMAYTIVLMTMRGETVRRCIVRALDIVTIVVPPALPAAMASCYVKSQKNLEDKQIFCVAPSKIAICGAINVVCFDKTGTLTEDGLDFLLIRPVDIVTQDDGSLGAHFTEECYNVDPNSLPQDGEMAAGIATCHSLTRIGGKLLGDPIDLLLFESTAWEFHEPTSPEISAKEISENDLYDLVQPSVMRPPVGETGDLAIIRQFTFTSELQRQSVLVASPSDETGKQMILYSKGSPEMIMSLCQPHTVPKDYLTIVNHYSHLGYRLIAVARRDMKLTYAKAHRIKREDAEKDLVMLGLVVMENRVKSVTPTVIRQLIDANIRAVMVTGDNVLTALSVGRECGIIREDRSAYLLEHHDEKDEKGRTILTYKHVVATKDEDLVQRVVVGDDGLREVINNGGHLSMTGHTFHILQKEHAELLPDVAQCCDVFARMAPDQKSTLVSLLQESGAKVMFTGDGANDCAALKAAHAGISLSDAEASIAAPFTSKIADIRCVPTVICEGRASLITAFSMIKYMAGYSLTQFCSIFILYHYGTNLTDGMFMYIDLPLITLAALLFGFAPASSSLYHRPPPTRILSKASCIAVLGQLVICAIGQAVINFLVINQPWYVPYNPPKGGEEDDKRAMVGTAVFLVSTIQYNALAFAYSAGKPHRQPIIRNPWLCLALLGTTLFSIFLALTDSRFVVEQMEFIFLPSFSFRLLCIFIGLVCTAFSVFFEKGFVSYLERYEHGETRTQVSANEVLTDVEAGRKGIDYHFKNAPTKSTT
ncbi:unnamed protein product, partial [Mesorhabditis belari]|uniref:Cation-transporting ATPase n=1 Tax=Mesorhabditis belari TaxID=2138241 RepID=A0AAF3J5I0_9BILA